MALPDQKAAAQAVRLLLMESPLLRALMCPVSNRLMSRGTCRTRPRAQGSCLVKHRHSHPANTMVLHRLPMLAACHQAVMAPAHLGVTAVWRQVTQIGGGKSQKPAKGLIARKLILPWAPSRISPSQAADKLMAHQQRHRQSRTFLAGQLMIQTVNQTAQGRTEPLLLLLSSLPAEAPLLLLGPLLSLTPRLPKSVNADAPGFSKKQHSCATKPTRGSSDEEEDTGGQRTC